LAELKKQFPDYYIFFTDGTVLELFDPIDPESHRWFWNTKHQMTAWSFFIVITPNGRIVYVSDVYGGSVYDKTSWNNSDINDLLKEKYGSAPTLIIGGRKKLAMSGDKAYIRQELPDGWFGLYTASAAAGDEDDPEYDANRALPDDPTRICNPEIAPFRSAVERAIMAIKRYRALCNIRTMSSNRKDFESHLNNLIRLACALCNWALDNGVSKY
jgi:hypothetical protein